MIWNWWKLFAQALKSSPELRNEKEKIEGLRSELSSFEYSFKTGFSDRVMHQITEDSRSESKDLPIEFIHIFKRIVFAGAAAIIALLFTIYFTDGALNIDSIYGLSEYSTYEDELAYYNFLK